MTSRLFFWLLLVLLLSFSTFGVWTCIIVLFSLLSAIIGFVAVIYSGKASPRLSINFHNAGSIYGSQSNAPFVGIPKVVIQMLSPSSIPKNDQRLTGSNEIDGPLREIISYIVRDFLQSWYSELSSDEDFIDGFNDLCKFLINSFSKSAKDVNWVTFITKRVVEDFTTHIRLYRHTEVAYRKRRRENPTNSQSMESVFFDQENDFEKNLCREHVCSSLDNEKEYLQSISDVILYLLLPGDDFDNTIMKHFLREVVTSSVLQPLFAQFTDPDFINQNLVWLCKDYGGTSKSLLNILRRSDNQDELASFIQISKHELRVQNSKDAGDKDEMKKYMKSIQFVQNIARQRFDMLQGHAKQSEIDSAEFYLDFDSTTDGPIFEAKGKLVSVPFDVILNNNIALHYFTQYLMNVNSEGFVFLYHNIESFRTTVETLSAENLNVSEEVLVEKLRSIALQVFDSYLGSNATPKVTLDDALVKKLDSRLKTEHISKTCFDEIQEKVYGILENEYYINGFKDSKMYVKLLAEMDLLSFSNSSSDLDSLSSSKSEEEETFNCDTVVPTDEEMLNELLEAELSPEFEFPEMSSGPLHNKPKEIGLLFAEVHSTGITHHAGRTFAVYAISVSHYGADGTEEKWFVVRRYSEFYDFHEEITSKYPILASFNFPAKKPFNNLTRQLMEKRRYMLNEFMQYLLTPDTLVLCPELRDIIYNFLQPNAVDKGKKSPNKIDTIINPIKSSVRTVGHFARMVPDTVLELKDVFMKALAKNNLTEPKKEEKVMSTKDNKTEDIPFRIMLLLMDEVFNLRNKDLWFRRRIMAILRQIIKTMQGGSINRKIREYVQGMTSVSQIAEWLKLLSKTIWPDGKLAPPAAEREHSTKMRTRLAAKMLILCAIPEELKHIIGHETSFKGAMLVFNMFQYPSLNRRLLIVLFESLITTLFPNNRIKELIHKLHSPSARINRKRELSIDKISCNSLLIDRPSTPEVSRKSPRVSKETLEVSTIKAPNYEKGEARSNSEKSRKMLLVPRSSPSQPNLLSSPKTKKRKKSVESAIFYTDLPTEEDMVILPLKS